MFKILKSEITWIIVGLAISFAAIPLRFLAKGSEDSIITCRAVPIESSRSLNLSLRILSFMEHEGRVEGLGEIFVPRVVEGEPLKATLKATPPSASFYPSNELQLNAGVQSAPFTVVFTNPSETGEIEISASAPKHDAANIRFPYPLAVKRNPPSAYLRPATDAASIAGVIILLCAYLVFLGTAPTQPQGVSRRLRYACGLVMLMALPSSLTNAAADGDPFWLIVTTALLTLILAVGFGHHTKKFVDAFKIRYRANTGLKVVVFLTISGGLGGLAFHLVKNDLRLEFPGVTYVGFVERPQNPNSHAETDSSNFLQKVYPDADKRPILARSQVEAYSFTSRNGQMPFFSVVTAVFAGALGDILVGMIAANAVHFFVAGLINHQNSRTQDEGDYSVRVNLTLVSLGIVAGFAGSRLLPEAATNLLERKVAQQNQTLQKVNENIKSLQDNKPDPTPQSSTSEANKLLERVVWPYLNFADDPSTLDPEVRAFASTSADPTARKHAPSVAVRAYYRLVDAGQASTTDQFREEIREILDGTSSGPDEKAAVQLLYARFLAKNGESANATAQFRTAQATASSGWVKDIAAIHLIWLTGPETIEQLPRESDQQPPKTLEGVFDQIRITRALCSISKATEVTNQAKCIYDATALYSPESWTKNRNFRKRFGNADATEKWQKAEASIKQLLDSVETKTKDLDPTSETALHKELDDLAKKYPDWELQSKAKEKLGKTLAILRSP